MWIGCALDADVRKCTDQVLMRKDEHSAQIAEKCAAERSQEKRDADLQ